MMKQTTTPYFLRPHGNIPNNPQLPLLVYEQVFSDKDNLLTLPGLKTVGFLGYLATATVWDTKGA